MAKIPPEKLAAALRANLKRRKADMPGAGEGTAGETAPQGSNSGQNPPEKTAKMPQKPG